MSSVNAVIITYNQAAFIEKAIKGAIEQKVSHDYTIIIHDDASTDSTTDICRRFKKQYPGLIQLLEAERNKGMAKSWKDAINACKANYVAICEGDDYWCDPGKLQKQVDFLEANPDYAISCHRVYYKNDEQRARLQPDKYMPSTEAEYDIAMMGTHGNLVATPSVVFRNKLFSSLPSWFDQTPIADYVVHMMNAQHGKIKYFPEPMAVYRLHPGGAWNGQPVMANASNMLTMLRFLLNEPFSEPVKTGLQQQLRLNRAIYLSELMQQDWDQFRTEFDGMMIEDKTTAMALIEKMRSDMEALQQSRTYKAVQKLKRLARFK